jgi:hypothetical protein
MSSHPLCYTTLLWQALLDLGQRAAKALLRLPAQPFSSAPSLVAAAPLELLSYGHSATQPTGNSRCSCLNIFRRCCTQTQTGGTGVLSTDHVTSSSCSSPRSSPGRADQFNLSLDPVTARAYHDATLPQEPAKVIASSLFSLFSLSFFLARCPACSSSRLLSGCFPTFYKCCRHLVWHGGHAQPVR